MGVLVRLRLAKIQTMHGSAKLTWYAAEVYQNGTIRFNYCQKPKTSSCLLKEDTKLNHCAHDVSVTTIPYTTQVITCYQLETLAGEDADTILSHHIHINLPEHWALDRSLGPICCFIEAPVYSNLGDRDWNHFYRNAYELARPANGAVQCSRLKKKKTDWSFETVDNYS